MNVQEVVGESISSLQGVLGDDWGKVSSFAEKQMKMLATQAAWIAESRTLGSLRNDDELFEFFTAQLERMTLNFVRSLAALTLLTVEEAWNAIVGVVWKHVNLALGAAGLGQLPVPEAPGV